MTTVNKPADAFKVPAHLADAYKRESEPTELDVLRALQGEGLKDYGLKMIFALWPNRGMVDEKQSLEQSQHPDFQRFVAHRMKLESAASKVSASLNEQERARNKAIWDAQNTCPICGEVAWFNTSTKPCKLCVVAIEKKLAATKAREAAVDKWLKSHTYDWVKKS